MCGLCLEKPRLVPALVGEGMAQPWTWGRGAAEALPSCFVRDCVCAAPGTVEEG